MRFIGGSGRIIWRNQVCDDRYKNHTSPNLEYDKRSHQWNHWKTEKPNTINDATGSGNRLCNNTKLPVVTFIQPPITTQHTDKRDMVAPSSATALPQNILPNNQQVTSIFSSTTLPIIQIPGEPNTFNQTTPSMIINTTDGSHAFPQTFMSPIIRTVDGPNALVQTSAPPMIYTGSGPKT